MLFANDCSFLATWVMITDRGHTCTIDGVYVHVNTNSLRGFVNQSYKQPTETYMSNLTQWQTNKSDKIWYVNGDKNGIRDTILVPDLAVIRLGLIDRF